MVSDPGGGLRFNLQILGQIDIEANRLGGPGIFLLGGVSSFRRGIRLPGREIHLQAGSNSRKPGGNQRNCFVRLTRESQESGIFVQRTRIAASPLAAVCKVRRSG